jgi:mono/diheme cytochrome c family protein
MRIRSRIRHLAAGPVFLVIFALAPFTCAAACRGTSGDWNAGSAIYHQTCINCHGEDGKGVRRGVPDFTTGVMAYSTESLLAHIKNGFRGPGRPLAMPPKGGNPTLTDDDIRNVLAYLRETFGCG